MKLVKSPLNYTGGKFRLLPQILPLFPRNIATFVDLFCGGGSVGANVRSERVWFNDINRRLISLLETFCDCDMADIMETISEVIAKYRLSESSLYGYQFYGCDSGKGLGNYNRLPFLNMRSDLNRLDNEGFYYNILLYVTIVYSFNNQIRFNSRGEFNLPVGKRDFNSKMRAKLEDFVMHLKNLQRMFSSMNFTDFDFDVLDEEDFVYADPPYLITCASYNENGGWSREMEVRLYNELDRLNERNIRFALSNLLSSKGKHNELLESWLRDRPGYICHHLDYNYSNSNYHTKNRLPLADEVLITNY